MAFAGRWMLSVGIYTCRANRGRNFSVFRVATAFDQSAIKVLSGLDQSAIKVLPKSYQSAVGIEAFEGRFWSEMMGDMGGYEK